MENHVKNYGICDICHKGRGQPSIHKKCSKIRALRSAALPKAKKSAQVHSEAYTICFGDGVIQKYVPVSWLTIKSIYAKAVEHFGT